MSTTGKENHPRTGRKRPRGAKRDRDLLPGTMRLDEFMTADFDDDLDGEFPPGMTDEEAFRRMAAADRAVRRFFGGEKP